MMKINSAYEAWVDPERRESYDQELHAAENTAYHHRASPFEHFGDGWDEQQAWEQQDEQHADYLYDADAIILLMGSTTST